MNSDGDDVPGGRADDGAGDGAAAPTGTGDVVPDDALIVLPIRNTVIFPGLIVPLSVGRPESVAAAQEAAKSGRSICVLLQRDPTVDEPGAEQLHAVGTDCELLRYITAPDGSHHIIVRGRERVRVLGYLDGFGFKVARVAPEPERTLLTPEIEAYAIQLRERAAEAFALLPNAPQELAAAFASLESPAAMADFVAGTLDLESAEKQSLLETFDVRERLEKVLGALSRRIEVLKLSRRIGERTQESIASHQREHLLREQLRQIRAELGEGEGQGEELAELGAAIGEAGMPEEVEREARKELGRLERMSDASMEHSMTRTYLDWLVELPWSRSSGAEIDVDEARRVLDADHQGLEKVKRRILEYLAVKKLNPGGRGPILCFVGPPGVGKTSLGKSIARATGRAFVRISLGGVHDESEIRGHRRTYVGALPGNIVQSLRKAGSNDPVFMLDELDKLGASYRGDPSSALLEVLDPEQNDTFRDNYLGVPFDLSHVLFIGTANVLDDIPGPLRDRMEVIELAGYTEEEKLEIARRHLVARQLEATGLTAERCEITEAALREIIAHYTREAGCRNLEREIGAVCRHAAVRIAEGTVDRVRIDAPALATVLGPRRFESEIRMRTGVSGVATGLAWTPVGGDILFVESNRVPGSGRLILTGQLGDVMKESATAALTLVKGHARALGIDEGSFEKSDVHVHVPAGAIPKDGPSAGVAMYVALVSLLIGRPVRGDSAMTGEISLRGLVLPVGGVKEKVLAAARAGITTVLLPERNRKDLDDVPPTVRERLTFVWLERVEDATAAALGAPDATAVASRPDDERSDATPA